MSLRIVYKELYRGKGFGRTLMNLAIYEFVELGGVVLDIGGIGGDGVWQTEYCRQ